LLLLLFVDKNVKKIKHKLILQKNKACFFPSLTNCVLVIEFNYLLIVRKDDRLLSVVNFSKIKILFLSDLIRVIYLLNKEVIHTFILKH